MRRVGSKTGIIESANILMIASDLSASATFFSMMSPRSGRAWTGLGWLSLDLNRAEYKPFDPAVEAGGRRG